MMPGRILDRHVGGNTTYARNLADGLRRSGICVEAMPAGNDPFTTLALETWQGRVPHGSETVLHYVADTGPLLRTKTPSLVTVHGVASAHIEGVRNPVQEKVWRSRVKRAIHSTNGLVTVSRSSARDISNIFDVEQSKISVIPHGIDTPRFSKREKLSDELASQIPSEYLLYLGNIEPRKNIIELVKAVSQKRVRDLGLPLLIAGKPAWNSGPSMAEIEHSSDVQYLGFVSDSDRIALMQRCVAFVFPSRYEGFGFPVLEALAAGAPVLTSDRGSLSEVAGPSDILVSIDADGIADGIVETVSGERRAPEAVAARRDWASRFNWEASVSSHLSLYREVSEK
jgi:glycosyltransferase involved in cell wall biosynthesis